MRHRTRALGAALATATVLVGAGCKDGGGGVAATTTTTTATTSDRSTTTLGATSTTGAPVQVPDPATRGEDFDRVFREILGFETWVFEHPDVKELDVIYTGEANIRPKVQGFLQNLVDKGWHYDDEGPVVHSVAVERRIDPLNVLLKVETSHGPQRVVDGGGKLVEQSAGWPRRREQYLLKQGDDGRWRIQNYANNGAV
ncbi:MAG: hypothetical protein ACR2MO_00515 [Acidimicrobiales bacterium]